MRTDTTILSHLNQKFQWMDACLPTSFVVRVDIDVGAQQSRLADRAGSRFAFDYPRHGFWLPRFINGMHPASSPCTNHACNVKNPFVTPKTSS